MKAPLKKNATIASVLPMDQCLAKTRRDSNGNILKGINVEIHCIISGLISGKLIEKFPQKLKTKFFPDGTQLLTAVHDIGKVYPHFQQKIYEALTEKINFKIGDSGLDNIAASGGHATVTYNTLTGISPKFIPEIAGRHHGQNPTKQYDTHAEITGGEGWYKERIELLFRLNEKFGNNWPIIKNEIHAEILSGLVCVSDWIASGPAFDDIGEENIENISDRVTFAVEKAGFIPFSLKSDLNFSDIFGFEPREIQRNFYSVSTKPGVYILEAPMGIGKTEAALYAAYKWLNDFSATGIYFALPTQLTSDKIYDRMELFLNKILHSDCKFRSLLLHSNAWLKDTELGEEGMPGREWFSSKKRGLLAPFSVGTVDQALLSVLNVRHNFVRTFGLIGKVVILDEVHTYDSYTGTVVDKLVETLAKIGCTVIILSATLTNARKKLLLNTEKSDNNYPLISSASEEGVKFCPITQSSSAKIHLTKCTDDKLALEEALKRAKNGQQVLWIENTVNDAQDKFKLISARASSISNISCGLIHSRFIQNDRSTQESYWVEIFGKSNSELRTKEGRILIGTQVLEQSLDIDSDFLISRLCPTDMLLQRLGRLWRHESNNEFRPKDAAREFWLLTPDFNAICNSVKPWEKSALVYSPYVLYRTLQIFKELDSILLPDDMRHLIESSYSEQNEAGFQLQLKNELHKTHEKLARFAKIGMSGITKPLPEEKVLTRFAEIETKDVLLLKSITVLSDYIHLKLLNNDEIRVPRSITNVPRSDIRNVAIKLMKSIVKVPQYISPETRTSEIGWLKQYLYLGNKDESFIGVGIYNDDNSVSRVDKSHAVKGYEISYDPNIGYTSRKTKYMEDK